METAGCQSRRGMEDITEVHQRKDFSNARSWRQLREHKTAALRANRKGREIRRRFEWRAASRDLQGLILFLLTSMGTLKFPLSIKTSLAPRRHGLPWGKQQMALSGFIGPHCDPTSALLT